MFSSKNTIDKYLPLINELQNMVTGLGLTDIEIQKYVADRLAIHKYLPLSANVLEIGSRPAVSIFVEQRKHPSAKHIVVDNDIGDRVRLNNLINYNNYQLKVIPIEEFVDIYSYNTVIIEESEGDTAELLSDLPLNKIEIIITSEMAENNEAIEEVSELLIDKGFEKKDTIVENEGTQQERVVDVFVKPTDEVTTFEDNNVIEPINEQVELLEDEIQSQEISAEPTDIVLEKTVETVLESETVIELKYDNIIHNIPSIPMVNRRVYGRRRPTMAMII